jgi:hypothetical protein
VKRASESWRRGGLDNFGCLILNFEFKRMKENNLIIDVSYAFALEVMRLTKSMRDMREFDLASQF